MDKFFYNLLFFLCKIIKYKLIRMPAKSKHNKHKRSVSRKSRKLNKKLNRKLNKKTKSRTRSQKRSKRSMKGGNGENSGCDYIKVEGMNLPGLVIENKMALIDADCKSTQPPLSAGEHPNMSK